MATINAGASASITLLAGYKLRLNGIGVWQRANRPYAQQFFQGSRIVGPFSDNQVIYVTSTTATTYNAPTDAVFAGMSLCCISGAVLNGTTASIEVATGYSITAGQWANNGSNISGATTLTYALTSGDYGQALTFTATGIPFTTPASIIPAPAAASVPSYSRMKAGMARVAAGTGYSKWLGIGDSTVAGIGSQGAGTLANCYPSSEFKMLRTTIAGMVSYAVSSSGWFGDQRVRVTNATALNVYNPEITLGSGWDATGSASGIQTLGGSVMTNASVASAISTLPAAQVDTFEVSYAINAGLGTFNLSRTGDTSSGNISQAGASGIGKVTFTGALGNTNALNINRVSGGVYILSVDAYNSNVKSLRLQQAGWSGGKVLDWITNAAGFDPIPAMLAQGADLHIIRAGTNNATADPSGTAVGTFKSQLTTLCTSALTVGDVILQTHFPIQISQATVAIQDLYAQAVRDVAASFSPAITVHDTYANAVSWVSMNAAGRMADQLHPNATGYQWDTNILANLIFTL